MSKRAIIVLSGGQDSTTCAFWAKEHGYELSAITFDYGQRHSVEIMAASRIAQILDCPHEVINIGRGILQGKSPLVSEEELAQYSGHDALPGGLEKTFVPMRNQLFLTIAANRAYMWDCNVLVTGVCEEDYGGYPDCRQDFISSLEQTCTLGTFTGEGGGPEGLTILTPLMALTKADSVRLALTLPGCYEALAFTHTSYDGQFPPTGKDHATLLRAKGFLEANTPDPLVLRAWKRELIGLPETPNYDRKIVDMYAHRVGTV
jgi:7-cyano-7-deazaguanine synthase